MLTGIPGIVEGEIIPNVVLSPLQWFCIQMGGVFSPFKCFFNCEGQNHHTVSLTKYLAENGVPKQNRTNVPLRAD